jgi:hypothetical protein
MSSNSVLGDGKSAVDTEVFSRLTADVSEALRKFPDDGFLFYLYDL